MGFSLSPQRSDNANQILLGMGLANLGMFMLPGMDAIAKYIGGTGAMSPGQVAFIRFFVQAVFFACWLVALSGVASLKPKRLWLNAVRGALIAIASVLFFIAVKYMPLADAIAVFFVEPLILTLLSFIVLREPVGWRRISAVIVGFIGALIVIQPSYSLFGPISLLPLVTATLFASYLLLNRVAGAYDSASNMQFIAGVSGTVVLGLAVVTGHTLGIEDMTFDWNAPLWIWGLALGMGIIGCIGHHLIVQAFKLAPASLLAPFQYIEIVAAVALGWLVFNELPTPSKWLGIAIIVLSGLYVFWREREVASAP